MSYNIIDIINKKRLKQKLNREELYFAFDGYLKGEIPDYQMSSLLMAICINDMSDEEIFDLTDIFINSGEQLDLSLVEGVKVDKHSTGGVGDKTTLIVAPIVAACGVKIAKMSGRGLGFTGGTIDKLESISGFNVSLTDQEFINQLNDINVAISSQTANLTPMDKVVYALRDVTATVESIPLIAVSIMSKKIASNADKILIDIKLGSGALIKTREDAERLSEIMIKIGNAYKREVRTVITNMEAPLGNNIGNSLEVLEAINILDGKEQNYLSELCILLSSKLISMAKGVEEQTAKMMVLDAISTKAALNKFYELVKRQGGDISSLKTSDDIVEIRSVTSGEIKEINAYDIGILARDLGAGRLSKEDEIDHSVGIVLEKSVGDKVNIGDILCKLYVNKKSTYTVKEVLDSFIIE